MPQIVEWSSPRAQRRDSFRLNLLPLVNPVTLAHFRERTAQFATSVVPSGVMEYV